MKRIAVIVGSLRKDSWNRKLAEVLISLAPKTLSLSIIEIGALPLYNQDLDEAPPKAWETFRAAVKPVDGVLFATPEYNRSLPAPLKNAIDVGSRPYGQSVWAKKPCAVISATIGTMGGFGANHHLRQCFVFLDMPCMQQPEAYIAGVAELFDKEGKIANPKTLEFLQLYVNAFEKWVSQF